MSQPMGLSADVMWVLIVSLFVALGYIVTHVWNKHSRQVESLMSGIVDLKSASDRNILVQQDTHNDILSLSQRLAAHERQAAIAFNRLAVIETQQIDTLRRREERKVEWDKLIERIDRFMEK